MQKKINLLLVLAILLISSAASHAQTDVRMQSVFIYNFTRLIAWPAEYQNGDFIIAVYGYSTMINEIEVLAESKKAGSQNIVSKSFSSTSDIDKCHILYVPSNHSRKIEEIVATLKAKNINALVVSDNRSAISSGAVINFTVVDSRQRFELSQDNARAMGLNPGSEISRLAIAAD